MTSGSAGVVAVAASAAAGASSTTRSATTWTSIVSRSLTGVHFTSCRDVAQAHALVQHQLADVDLDVLRDVAGQALDRRPRAWTKSRMPPCCFTPFGSPLSDDGHRDRDRLVHRDAVEVRVQQVRG